MPQFFMNQSFAKDDVVEIRGSDARHILSSLRLSKGDWIVLSDGDGRSFRAVIDTIQGNSLTARVGEEIKRMESALPPVLALALAKKERFEWCIEKAVELGCRRIIPFASARCVTKIGSDAQKKKTRWNEIALSAAKQSGLPFRPCVDAPISFDDLCSLSGEFDHSIILFEGEDDKSVRDFWNSDVKKSLHTTHLIVIGPEGGFTNVEIDLAKRAKMTPLSLGQQILRVETAAISALSVWQYELGNMSLRS